MNLFSLSADIQLDDNAFIIGLRNAGADSDKFADDFNKNMQSTALAIRDTSKWVDDYIIHVDKASEHTDGFAEVFDHVEKSVKDASNVIDAAFSEVSGSAQNAPKTQYAPTTYGQPAGRLTPGIF
jgi:hypothetical protein